MSFAVILAQDVVAVDPGSSQPLSIELVNEGSVLDNLEVTVEGLDPSWTALPEASVVIDPGKSHKERIVFRIPRESESASGSYPFLVRVRSLNSGEGRTVQGILEVKPFYQLSLDVEPRRVIVSPFQPESELTLRVLNLGNTEQELQFFANDPDHECTYSFELEKAVVGPGQQRTLQMTLKTRKRSVLSASKLFAISLSARSTANATVAAYSNAQLEVRPLLSPVPFFSVLAVVGIFTAWFLTIPKPPRIDVFGLDRKQLIAGESTTISWRVEHASSVVISVNNEPIKTSVELAGSTTFTPKDPGSYNILLVASKNDKRVERTAVIVVKAPDVLPDPEIDMFTVSKTKVAAGEPIKVTYGLGDGVTKATLLPVGLVLDVEKKTGSVSIVPTWFETQDLILEVQNSAGKTARRTISVEVFKKEENLAAKIVTFSATPMILKEGEGDKVTLRWSLTNCQRAEISYGGIPTTIDPVQGSLEISVSTTSTVTLRAYDKAGKFVEKQITLTVEGKGDLPDQPEDPASPGGSTPPATPNKDPEPSATPN